MNHWIERDFFDGAVDMRAAFTDHFAKPVEREESKHVWNFWYVPELYTYLRADAATVLPEPLVVSFMQKLRAWSRETLGIAGVSGPRLSVYFNGCGQCLHNDARNGSFGYVYSLTPWDTRTFTGGETIVLREDDYWNTDRVLTPGALTDFCHLVPANFNQLLVFDDRLVHGVRHVQGQMDPLQGRVVLHGHILNDGARVVGALSEGGFDEAWERSLSELEARLDGFDGVYDGLVSLRIAVDRHGRVNDTRVLVDRLVPTGRPSRSPREVSQTIVTWANTLRFPDAKGDSTIYAPFALSSE
jgi:hypothetical protein